MLQFDSGFALVVGVGGDLPNTVNDARAIANVLKSSNRCGYPSRQVHVLLGPASTRDSIFGALDTLAAKSTADSTVLIYFSGHGFRRTSGPQSGRSYLLPFGYDLEQLQGTSISATEFSGKIKRLRVKKLLVLLDCCHAGSMVKLKNASGEELAPTSMASDVEDIFKQGSGRVVICSSRENEPSFAGHPYSAFTTAVLESFSGLNSDLHDGYVRVSDLVLHARETVPRRTAGRQHPTIMFRQADNFRVCLYAGGSKAVQETDLPFTLLEVGSSTAADQYRPATSIVRGSIIGGDAVFGAGTMFIGGSQFQSEDRHVDPGADADY